MLQPMVLVGLMGSGKTTLARRLGSELHVPVIDTDRWIEEQENRKVHEIVLQDGWDYFRRKEMEFCQAFEFSGPCVISTGGGFPTFEGPFNWIMKNTCGVYLEVSPETALKRILLEDESKTAIRPLLSGLNLQEQEATLQRMYHERCGIYKKFPFTVNANNPVETVLRDLIKIASKT